MKKKIKISKLNVIRAIFIALIIVVMVIIFVLSAQDSIDSSDTSGGLTAALLSLFGIDSGSMSEAEFTKAEALVRSAAHFSEYALLAFLAAFLLATYKIKRACVLLFSVAFAAFYAITDEIHQIFVPGRAAQISDWLIDVSGAFLGATVVLMILGISAAAKKRRYTPKNKKMKKSKA